MKKAFFVINYTGGFGITEAEDHTEIVLRDEGVIHIVSLEAVERLIQDYRNLKTPLPEGEYFDEVKE